MASVFSMLERKTFFLQKGGCYLPLQLQQGVTIVLLTYCYLSKYNGNVPERQCLCKQLQKKLVMYIVLLSINIVMAVFVFVLTLGSCDSIWIKNDGLVFQYCKSLLFA